MYCVGMPHPLVVKDITSMGPQLTNHLMPMFWGQSKNKGGINKWERDKGTGEVISQLGRFIIFKSTCEGTKINYQLVSKQPLTTSSTSHKMHEV